MRLTPVVPITGLEPFADTEVEGVQIPAGTRLFLLHRYAGLQSIERAEEFKPERWLDEDDELPVPDQKSFLTFGAGPRFCPGRNLAFLEAKTALGMIARNFEIELDPAARAGHRAARLHDEPQGTARAPARADTRDRRLAISSARAIREVAGAGQRLPDRRGRRASLGADAWRG